MPVGKALKKLALTVTDRVFVTGVLILVQLFWFLFVFIHLTRYSALLTALLQVASLVIVLGLVKSDDNPSYRIAWITLVMALPVFGGFCYLIAGNKRPSRRMRKRIEVERRRLAPLKPTLTQALERLRERDVRAAGRSEYLKRYGCPLYENSRATYYPIGEEMFAAMLEALEAAEHFIFMEYFIIEDGEMWRKTLEVLQRKARAGVDVRLIYDDFGCLTLLPNSFVQDMESRGIKCLRFNPFVPFLSMVMNTRDHRKIMVIDGYVAFNGGINLADEYINRKVVNGHWKDTGVKVRGDAVWSFTLMFLEMWNAFRREEGDCEDFDAFRPHAHHPEAFETDGFVQPFDDSPLDDEPVSATTYIDILAQAKRYAYIFTPYLIIDDLMRAALANAAKRGVDVRIVTPGIPDKKLVFRLTRSNYPPLLSAGVRIFEYTPGFIHAKSMLSDDCYGLVGTVNLDYRSLFLHFECGTYLYGAAALDALKADKLATLAKCREVTTDDCREGFWGRLLDAVLRAFAPLF